MAFHRLETKQGFRAESWYRESWALIIGINSYLHMPPLSFAVKDADDVAQAFRRQYHFPSDNIILLQDDHATRENILSVFDTHLNQHNVADDDRIVIFFAGHGVTRTARDGSKFGYIAPIDAEPHAWRSLIGMSDLVDQAHFLPARHILFVMDACYSGLTFKRSSVVEAELNHFFDKPAVQVLTAGTANQQVADGGDWEGQNSIFTGYFLDALSGSAATASGLMTAGDVMQYVYRGVTSDPNSDQTPQYGWVHGDGDMIFRLPTAVGLPLGVEAALRQGSIPSKLYALNELTALANEDDTVISGLAMQRLREIAERETQQPVRHMALRLLGEDFAPSNSVPQDAPTRRSQAIPEIPSSRKHPSNVMTVIAVSVLALVVCIGTGLASLFAYWRVADAATTEPRFSLTPTVSPTPYAIGTAEEVPFLPELDVQSRAEIVFEDDFVMYEGWWEDTPSSWKANWDAENNELRFDVNAPYGLWINRPRDVQIRDGMVVATARFDKAQADSSYGLVFRQLDFDNYYYYKIGADSSYALILQRDGAIRELIAPTPLGSSVLDGEPHQMAVQFKGDTIQVYFDGELVGSARNGNLLANGTLGLAVQSTRFAPVSVTFDDFRVYSPDILRD